MVLPDASTRATMAHKLKEFAMNQVAQGTATETNAANTEAGTASTEVKAKKVRAKKEPVAKEPKAPSKAEISREIMTRLHGEGKSYEDIIAEMIRVNGYDRQLARGTYKANFAKAGVPAPVEGQRGAKKKVATVTVDTPAADTPASTEAPAAEAAPV